MELEIVKQRLDETGIMYEMRSYDPTKSSALDAADEIKLPREQILKTLLFKDGTSFLLFILPSKDKLDVAKVCSVLHLNNMRMASYEEVLEVTGHDVGKVTPIVLTSSLPIYMEDSILAYDLVGIASGTKGFEVVLSPRELQNIISAQIMSLLLV